MATFNKTSNQVLFPIQSIPLSSVVVGSALDVQTKLGGLVYVRFGRRAATAAGAGANIRLEASKLTSGNNSWFPFAIFTTGFAAANSNALTTAAAGATVLLTGTTTGFVQGTVATIDNSTITLTEWVRVVSISGGVSVTVEEGIVNTASTFNINNSAEIYAPVAIPEGAVRIRCVADGSAFTQAWVMDANVTTIDAVN